MSRAKSYHVKTLQRRRDYLVEKIAARAASSASLSYVKHELAALEWALPILAAITQMSQKHHALDYGQKREEFYGDEKI